MTYVDHVCVLVEDLGRAAAALPGALIREPVEEQPAEGTREQYIQAPKPSSAALLLVQAVGTGPYRRALERRGPGLHHIAVAVPDLDLGIAQISEARLLLHPSSIRGSRHGTVWACRPGIPFLVEVMVRDPVPPVLPPLVETLSIPIGSNTCEGLRGLLGHLVRCSSGGAAIFLSGYDTGILLPIG